MEERKLFTLDQRIAMAGVNAVIIANVRRKIEADLSLEIDDPADMTRVAVAAAQPFLFTREERDEFAA